jgi:hypothetical protein
MNRYLTQFPLSFEKRVVNVFAHVTFGASGAPTLDTVNSKGILSIVRNSAGNYTVKFGTNSILPLDTYVKLLEVRQAFVNATAPAAPGLYITSNSIASGSLVLQFNNGGTSTDPASGEQVYLQFILGDSSAP